jgi:hypothetical protein
MDGCWGSFEQEAQGSEVLCNGEIEREVRQSADHRDMEHVDREDEWADENM